MDKVKTFCHICKGPLTEGDFLAGFAVEEEVRAPDRAAQKVKIHLFHTQRAQDVLQDEAYMEAVGFFISKLGFMKENKNIDEMSAREVGKQVAEEFNLEFDKLELAISAFYSYSIKEIRDGKDGTFKER